MKLTPFAKFFITVVILAVVGYAAWHYKGADIRKWATGNDKGQPSTTGQVGSNDFDSLKNAPADPSRDAAVTGVSATSVSAGKLNRPLVVAINTWAGHSPGIVFNNGLEPSDASSYRKK